MPSRRMRNRIKRAGAPRFSWRDCSLDQLREFFPDQKDRIEVCVLHLLYYCANSCRRKDWRHLASLCEKSLKEDLAIKMDEDYFSSSGDA